MGRSEQQDQYHKRTKECVADRHADGDENMIRVETGL